jgi:hypothetical protein
MTNELINELAYVLARHQPIGRDWQKACEVVAHAYCPPDELDPWVNADALVIEFRRLMEGQG